MSNFGYDNDYPYGGDTGQGFMANTSPDKGDKKGVFRNKNTIIPVTLKQLIEAKHDLPTDQHYKVDGKELVYGRVVGRITQFEDEAAQCRFTMIDGTTDQPISFHLYITQTDPTVFALRRTQLPNKIAECTFQARAGTNSNGVTVLDVRPLTDSNAITHHMLDVLNTHLFNTRGPLPRGGQSHQHSPMHGDSSISNVARGAMLAHSGDPFSSSSSLLSSSSFGAPGTNVSDAEYLLELFREHSERTENGASIREIAQIVAKDSTKRHLTKETIAKIADELLMDGRIYSTVDEDHFKTTS